MEKQYEICQERLAKKEIQIPVFLMLGVAIFTLARCINIFNGMPGVIWSSFEVNQVIFTTFLNTVIAGGLSFGVVALLNLTGLSDFIALKNKQAISILQQINKKEREILESKKICNQYCYDYERIASELSIANKELSKLQQVINGIAMGHAVQLFEQPVEENELSHTVDTEEMKLTRQH